MESRDRIRSHFPDSVSRLARCGNRSTEHHRLLRQRGREDGFAPAHEFVRLFMVRGMQHCGGGVGPNSFVQLTVGAGDADHDIDAALERWVEKNMVPERIAAVKHANDYDPKSDVVRTRQLCAY